MDYVMGVLETAADYVELAYMVCMVVMGVAVGLCGAVLLVSIVVTIVGLMWGAVRWIGYRVRYCRLNSLWLKSQTEANRVERRANEAEANYWRGRLCGDCPKSEAGW